MTRSGEDYEHIRERIRKARVAMGWVWSYGERKFKGDVRWRLKLFDSIVKGILYYGMAIWIQRVEKDRSHTRKIFEMGIRTGKDNTRLCCQGRTKEK